MKTHIFLQSLNVLTLVIGMPTPMQMLTCSSWVICGQGQGCGQPSLSTQSLLSACQVRFLTTLGLVCGNRVRRRTKITFSKHYFHIPLKSMSPEVFKSLSFEGALMAFEELSTGGDRLPAFPLTWVMHSVWPVTPHRILFSFPGPVYINFSYKCLQFFQVSVFPFG